MADVFVSYSKSNRDRVEQISDGLEAGGYSLWWDRRLVSGGDYGMAIEREIDAAGCVVVAWSAAARQSLWVRAEANEALDSGKLVQVNLDSARLPLPFTMLHFLDFSSWRGERQGSPWADLDGRVAAMLRGEPLDAEPAPAEAEAVPRGPALQGLGRTAMLGWASILLSALIAAAIPLALAGSITPAAFGALALAGLTVAAVVLALTAAILLRVALASRR